MPKGVLFVWRHNGLKRLCYICYNGDMKYSIVQDIKVVLALLNIAPAALAEELGVSRIAISRILKGEVYPSDMFLESFYSYAYENPYRSIRLNDLKVQFARDEWDSILFHGARISLEGPIDLTHSRINIDAGQGFYLGETFEQASAYVFADRRSSVYLFDSKALHGLTVLELPVSIEWMLMIAFYRGQLGRFKDHPIVRSIVGQIENSDVVIAPIADNNMYDIINRFARGDLTDKQACSALSASHLGKQHVLKSKAAVEALVMVNRLYLCGLERRDIDEQRRKNAMTSHDKSKLAIETYRRQGNYIEEVLK